MCSVPPPFYLPLNIALYLCLLANGLAAFFAPIQDCDEVFNFWEPAHYLDHGYGLQTWEYSPVYSIRSWLYVSLHAVVGKLSMLVVHSKTGEFYFIRTFLAFFCAACQTRLYSSICRSINPRIGLLFLTVMLFSPGMFHASTAFLPSTFTMYTSMLGLAAFLDLKNGPKIAQGIMWFALGAVVGWPFAGALIVPLIAEEGIIAILSGSLSPFILAVVDGAFRCLSIVVRSRLEVSQYQRRKLTFFTGSRGYNRLCIFPQNCLGSLEHLCLQRTRRARKRPRYLWHRAMDLLHSEPPTQFQYLVCVGFAFRSVALDPSNFQLPARSSPEILPIRDFCGAILHVVRNIHYAST